MPSMASSRWAAGQPGQGADESRGVRVERFLNNCCTEEVSPSSAAHDSHPVAEIGDNAQIVGNHNDAHIPPLPNILEELEDLCLNGDIQCGGSSAISKSGSQARQWHHHSPPHSSRKLVGDIPAAAGGIGYAAKLQQLQRFCLRLLFGKAVGSKMDSIICRPQVWMGLREVMGLEKSWRCGCPAPAAFPARSGQQIFSSNKMLPAPAQPGAEVPSPKRHAFSAARFTYNS